MFVQNFVYIQNVLMIKYVRKVWVDGYMCIKIVYYVCIYLFYIAFIIILACDFQCESDGKCILNKDRCNGYPICSDGSDEMNCGKMLR